jgi:hypothetical protein
MKFALYVYEVSLIVLEDLEWYWMACETVLAFDLRASTLIQLVGDNLCSDFQEMWIPADFCFFVANLIKYRRVSPPIT